MKNYFSDFDNSSVTDLLSKDNHKAGATVNLSDFEKKNFKQIKIDVLRT